MKGVVVNIENGREGEPLEAKEAAMIQRASERAKKIGNATVIIIFRNRKFDRADVNQHHSRVA